MRLDVFSLEEVSKKIVLTVHKDFRELEMSHIRFVIYVVLLNHGFKNCRAYASFGNFESLSGIWVIAVSAVRYNKFK